MSWTIYCSNSFFQAQGTFNLSSACVIEQRILVLIQNIFLIKQQPLGIKLSFSSYTIVTALFVYRPVSHNILVNNNSFHNTECSTTFYWVVQYNILLRSTFPSGRQHFGLQQMPVLVIDLASLYFSFKHLQYYASERNERVCTHQLCLLLESLSSLGPLFDCWEVYLLSIA